jgi:hypothetical protein
VVDTAQPTPIHERAQMTAAVICAPVRFFVCFLFSSTKLTIVSNGDLCYATPNHLRTRKHFPPHINGISGPRNGQGTQVLVERYRETREGGYPQGERFSTRQPFPRHLQPPNSID